MGILYYAEDGSVFPIVKIANDIKIQIAMVVGITTLLQLLLMVAQQMRYQMFGYGVQSFSLFYYFQLV